MADDTLARNLLPEPAGFGDTADAPVRHTVREAATHRA